MSSTGRCTTLGYTAVCLRCNPLGTKQICKFIYIYSIIFQRGFVLHLNLKCQTPFSLKIIIKKIKMSCTLHVNIAKGFLILKYIQEPKHENITKTRTYNFDPLKPHFYIVKLGFTGVFIIFLISAQKHRLWVLVRSGSNEYPQSMFLSRNMKNIRVFCLKISSFGGEIFLYI